MNKNDIFNFADWVTFDDGCYTPYVRGTFNADNTGKTYITISGLGFFELYINGKKATEDIFVPAWSNYVFVKRECKSNGKIYDATQDMLYRTYAMKYDITSLIQKGNNSVGVLLGGGWLTKEHYFPSARLCFSIVQGEKVIYNSGNSLKYKESFIESSKILYGEVQNFNKETDGWNMPDFDDSKWKNAFAVEPHDSKFMISDCPTDYVERFITPSLIKNFGEYSVYDIGENISCWVYLKLKGENGDKTEVIFSEEISDDGNLAHNTYYVGGNPHKNVYITDGNKERICHEHFMWQAGRYFSVTNNAEVVKVGFVHSNVKVDSSFKSDNDTLNWLYDAFVRTQLSNMHCSIPSDCPQREGRGYTGDGQLAMEAVLSTIDCERFYRKWLEDIYDCQNVNNGHVQYTAPFIVSGGGPGGWGCAIVHVPFMYYKNFGDKSVLSEFFPKMLKYFDYLDAHSENDLIVSEEEWTWCLGDWCTPGEIKIPQPLVNNYFYVKSLYEAIETAKVIGKDEFIESLKEKAGSKKKALIKAYYNEKTCNFADDIQGTNAMMLDIGLGNETTFSNTVKKHRELGMYDTGIFGTDILTRVLFERGEEQLAFDLLTNSKEISFERIKNLNATTLWEYWEGHNSHSHPMFGAVITYLFRHILGINQKDDSICYNNVIIAPKFVKGLNKAKGFITTKNGIISVEYEINDSVVKMFVDIPNNNSASFKYKDSTFELQNGKNSLEFRLI